MRASGVDRLFCPLTAEAFGWWLQCKTHELRKDAPRWSAKHVYPGRRIELRKGYSGPSLWGEIVEVIRGPMPDLSKHDVHPWHVMPGAARYWWEVAEVVGTIGIVVAFRVRLDPGQGVSG